MVEQQMTCQARLDALRIVEGELKIASSGFELMTPHSRFTIHALGQK
jgi:hypothetical protein